MKHARRAALITLTAIGCASCDSKKQQSNATADAPAPTAVAPAQPEATNPTIVTEHGIGIVTAGMTLGELRKSLPPGMKLGDIEEYMVDISAIPVIAGNDTLYHVVMNDAAVDDTAHIEAVASTNPRIRTAEGVGPGTTLADAVARYGKPTLSYNTNNESREYAEFPSHKKESNIVFRVQPFRDANTAGGYSTQGEYNTTQVFDPRATIMMVWVNRAARVSQ